MEKILDLKDKKIRLNKVYDNYSSLTLFEQCYLDKNNEIEKTFLFMMDDDFIFNGWTINDETDLLEFEFDINNPFYFPFNTFLDNKDNSFIIYDDKTKNNDDKYMIISKKDFNIKLSFINKKINKYYNEEFSVFIKNILPDIRSKIKIDSNTKEKLLELSNNLYDVIAIDNHQITINEYIEFNEYNKTKIKKLDRG